jgi:hypothetical protein
MASGIETRYPVDVDEEKPPIGERLARQSWMIAVGGLVLWIIMLWLMFGDVL